MYTENALKDWQGGLKQLRVENKSVPILATPEAGNRCHVHILDLYLSKLPPIAKDKDLFYWRPFDTVPKDPAAPWYTASPVGKNVLGDMMKNICKEAGIVGKKTEQLEHQSFLQLVFQRESYSNVLDTGHWMP